MKARPSKNPRFAKVKVKKTKRAGNVGMKKPANILELTYEDQRAFVWEKRLEGNAQYDIAKALGVSQQRVSQLLKEAYETKRAARLETADDLIEMELERIDRMIFAWWRRASKEERASEVYLKWVERRHKVLGIEINKTELSGRGGGPLQISATNIDITKLNDQECEWLEIIWRKAGPRLPEDDNKPKALTHKRKESTDD